MRLSRFLVIFTFSTFFTAHSTDQLAEADDQLLEALKTIKEKTSFLVNKTHTKLPTEEDFELLEEKLGYKLPRDLKLFHLHLGNLVFGEIDNLPTVHNEKKDGEYESDLYRYILDRHVEGVTDAWIPFCLINTAIVCIAKDAEEGKEEIGYFSNSWAGLRIEGTPHPNLLSWLKEILEVN